jgi:zinc-binding alcohol dehydrogenase/oxidoreductase
MKAALLKEVNKPLEITTQFLPPIAHDEVLVKLRNAAVNHRDVWIQQGQYGKIKLPALLGSDGCGIVCDTSTSHREWLNKEVVINPNINWGENEAYQSSQYSILGMPTPGTFAEYVKVKVDRIHEKPVHLSSNEAAALPLAALTAFRAIFTKAQVLPGEKVLISGVGGGVALFAMQFAVAAGAEVYVTSGSDEKILKAKKLGAAGGFNYSDAEWPGEALSKAGTFDVIIDSAGGKGFSQLLKVAGFGARIVFYGGTKGNFENLSPQMMFWKQIHLMGTTMGSDRDFENMLRFVSQKQLKPVLDSVWSLEKIQEAFAHMNSGNQFGKIVIEINA